MRRPFVPGMAPLVASLFVACGVGRVSAETDYASTYTWEIVNGEAHILDVKKTLSGEVTIPAELDGYPVTSVGVAERFSGLKATAGRDGFNGQTRITAVTIPTSVKIIGDDAFRGCTALERVTLSSSAALGQFAFRDCTSLRELDATYLMPNPHRGEMGNAFYGCANLRFVGPEDKVVDGSLISGSWLTRAAAGEETVTVPEEITMLDYAAFGGSSKLKTVHFMGPPPLWYYWNAPAENCVFSPTITTVTYRSKYAAEWEEFLEGKDTWTVRCAVLSGDSYPVKTMTFDVEPYDTWALQGNAKYLTYEKTSAGGSIIITGLSNKQVSGELVIPEEIGGLPVVGFKQDAFTDCTRITSLTVPGTIAQIGLRNFVRMTGLKEIIFQEGVSSISWGAFSDCSALSRVVIPASCTTIDPAAFRGCTGITFEVAADNTAFSSKDGALLSQDGSTLLLAPGNVAAYTIPVGVTTVAEQAFQNNVALTSVIVPADVTTIEARAFAACTKLAKVDFRGLPPATIGEEAFGTCQAGAYIATYWREWGEVLDETGVWKGLTMTTTPLTLTINRVGTGSVRDGATTISRFPATRSYQPGRTITLTAAPTSGNALLGWSGDGSFETDGMTVTFASENMTEITVHFVTQAVADSIEAVGIGQGGPDTSLEEALASGEVVRKEDIPNLVKDMAFGAPIIEVQDDTIRVGIDIQAAETLGDWKSLDLQNVELQSDAQERLMLILKKPVNSTAQFYKFVLPDALSFKTKR